MGTCSGYCRRCTGKEKVLLCGPCGKAWGACILQTAILSSQHLKFADLHCAWRRLPLGFSVYREDLARNGGEFNVGSWNSIWKALRPPWTSLADIHAQLLLGYPQGQVHDYATVAIYLKNLDGSEVPLIGDGGVFRLDPKGKPCSELYHALKSEFWSKWYSTEFVRRFMDGWRKLPRQKTFIDVQAMPSGQRFYVQETGEMLGAEMNMSNRAGINVAENLGFRRCNLMPKEREVGYWK